MTKYSRKKKEKEKIIEPPRVSSFTEHVAKQLERPVSEFVSKDVWESIVSTKGFIEEIEKKIQLQAKNDIEGVKKDISSLDEEIANGLPLLDKHQKDHVEKEVSQVKKTLGELEKKVLKRISEKEFRGQMLEIDASIREYRDKHGEDLRMLGENYRDLGLKHEGHYKKFNDIDAIIKKMADDLEKAGKIFEFGYSLGISKNGTFQGNTGFLNFKNGTNTTVRIVGNGAGFDIFIDSSGGSSANFVDNEVVSGSGTTFTLANTPVVGSEHIFGEGQRLTPGAGNDYTISGAVITLANSFSSGTILADYRTS